MPEGEPLDIRDAGDGMYVVENAYVGTYEYFDGRPIKVDVTPSQNEETAEVGEVVIEAPRAAVA